MSQAKETLLIKNVTIVDKDSSQHLKKSDILIEKGFIKKIGKNLKESFGSEVISMKDLHVSIGWMDLHVNVQDPGFEHKEDINSALNAAAAGGFTEILSCSTTEPVIDNKSGVEYQLRKSDGHVCSLHASGAMSQGGMGKEMSELFDMHSAGAKAFYDYKSNVHNTQLLKLSLLYTKSFNGLVMCLPSERYLTDHGLVHEGEFSTINGLQGIPEIAEDIGVQRALKVLEYADHRLHLTSLSTTNSIQQIKKAKKSGLNVSCGVNVANLLYTDNEIESFDSNFKLLPPLRGEKTRKQLLKALATGTIDVVNSDHWPQNVESKDCEFEHADFGMSALETSYSMLNTAMRDIVDQTRMIEILSIQPRNVLGIPIPSIKEGEAANITLFQPNTEWTFDLKNSRSKSRNSPLDGKSFIGKVVGIVNNGSYYLN